MEEPLPSQPSPARPSSSGRAADWVDLFGLALAVLLFCLLALWQIDRPGLYQDEAFDAAPAIYLIQGTGGWAYSLLPGSLDLPLMVCDHVGPTSTYLMIPFLYAFGVGPHAVRLYEFACGLAGLILIFFWARRVLVPGSAWIAALLLAATPSLWLACRNGLHVSFIIVPLAAGALICLDRWYRGDRPRWLYSGCFLLGVGFSTKILFLWLLAALAIGLLVGLRPLLRRLRLRDLPLGLLSFALGAGPFLLFNLLSRGLTFRTILASLNQTPYGIENTAFLPNLWTQLHSLSSVVQGSWLTWTGATPHNYFAPLLLAVAAAYLLLHLRTPGLRRVHFCLLAIIIILIASCFTISTLDPKHLVILLPFLPVVVVAAITLAWSRRSQTLSRRAFVVLSLLAALQFGQDLRNDLRYHESLTATGGVGLFSSAHNQLASWLLANDISQPLAGDWGFMDNLSLVSAGEIRARQIFGLADPPPFPFTREQARRTLQNPESVYLFHAEEYAAAPDRLAAVREVADELDLHLIGVATFTDGLGRPVIHVYRAVPEP